jgi:hypothetical protein
VLLIFTEKVGCPLKQGFPSIGCIVTRKSLHIIYEIICRGEVNMKKWMMIFSLLFFLLGGQQTFAQQGYQKYGRIAIAVVKEDYTGEKLADYKYDGRKSLTGGQVKDTFTFDVVKDGKDVTVKVNVVHNPAKPADLTISLIEVP